MNALRILLHMAIGLTVVYGIFTLKTRFSQSPCPEIVAKEYSKGALHFRSHHFLPLLALFPKDAARFLGKNIPLKFIQPFDEFICDITPVFTGALEDLWLTSVMDFFLPLFTAALFWMCVESVLNRKGSGGLALLIVKAVPVLILLGQLGTIALFLNVAFIPAWILIQKRTVPSAPALDQSGGVLAYLFAGLVIYTGGLLGQPRETVLYGVTLFQFAPVLMCFVFWRPISYLASIPFASFLGDDRLKALDRLYSIAIGSVTSLHIASLVRFALVLLNYSNPPTYALPHTTKNPSLDFDSIYQHFTTVKVPADAPKILALDALVVAAGLILVLVLQGRGKRDGKGNFSHLLLLPAKLVLLGPGAVFLSWARDYTLNVIQEPVVVESKKKN